MTLLIIISINSFLSIGAQVESSLHPGTIGCIMLTVYSTLYDKTQPQTGEQKVPHLAPHTHAVAPVICGLSIHKSICASFRISFIKYFKDCALASKVSHYIPNYDIFRYFHVLEKSASQQRQTTKQEQMPILIFTFTLLVRLFSLSGFIISYPLNHLFVSWFTVTASRFSLSSFSSK